MVSRKDNISEMKFVQLQMGNKATVESMVRTANKVVSKTQVITSLV